MGGECGAYLYGRLSCKYGNNICGEIKSVALVLILILDNDRSMIWLYNFLFRSTVLSQDQSVGHTLDAG